MRKSAILIFLLNLIIIPQIVFSDENLQFCVAGVDSGECEQESDSQQGLRKKSFTQRSLRKGLAYFHEHAAPLSLLVPKTGWYRSEVEYGMAKNKLIKGLVDAQIKLVSWFRVDMESGKKVPVINWSRLLEINQMVVGERNSDHSKKYTSYDQMFTSKLVKEYITNNVIADVGQDINNLRKAAEKKFPDQMRRSYDSWGYAVKAQYDDSTDSHYFMFNQDDMKFIFHQRATDLDKYFLSEKGKEYAYIKNDRGGYATELINHLNWFDAARFCYESLETALDFGRDFKMSGYTITGSDPMFYLFGIPDIDDKTSSSYPDLCTDCKREWLTFIPTGSDSDLMEYSSVYLITAPDFLERKAMFDTALSIFTNKLKPSMKEKELVELVAQSWRLLALPHIFPDGNGRTLRLLMNAVLMAYSMPPLTCDPDCLPFSHLRRHFREDVYGAMALTREKFAKEPYPQWLVEPQDTSLLDKLRRL